MDKLIKDKKVIIVGPAGYLEGKNLGEYIDSFDVVVKINYALLNTNYKDYGKRTDVLYNYLCEDPHGNVDVLSKELNDKVLEKKPKFIITTFAKPMMLQRYKYMLKNRIKHILLEREFFDSVGKEVINAPNTGIVAIKHLLSLEPKSLNVVGFDFYEGGYQKGYLNQKGNNNKVHNNFSQLMYLDLLCKGDSRIIIDDRLKSVISKNKQRLSIIIPFESEDEHRKNILQYSLNRYKQIIPEAEVLVSSDGVPDKWIKGKAVNEGVKKAKGDIILIIDSDVILPYRKIIEMLKKIDNKGFICIKGDKIDINEQDTKDLISGNKLLIDCDYEKRMQWNKAVFCMTKTNFKNYDERFEGWGGEEIAFYITLEKHFGKPKLIKSNFYHLWHEVQDTKQDYKTNILNKNKALLGEYKKAKSIKDIEEIG